MEPLGRQIAGAVANTELFGRLKETEEALKKSKELFKKVFVSQRDAIFVLDESAPPKYWTVCSKVSVENIFLSVGCRPGTPLPAGPRGVTHRRGYDLDPLMVPIASMMGHISWILLAPRD